MIPLETGDRVQLTSKRQFVVVNRNPVTRTYRIEDTETGVQYDWIPEELLEDE
jgi:hypothetical protein